MIYFYSEVRRLASILEQREVSKRSRKTYLTILARNATFRGHASFKPIGVCSRAEYVSFGRSWFHESQYNRELVFLSLSFCFTVRECARERVLTISLNRCCDEETLSVWSFYSYHMHVSGRRIDLVPAKNNKQFSGKIHFIIGMNVKKRMLVIG